jgi:hypothetical protein
MVRRIFNLGRGCLPLSVDLESLYKIIKHPIRRKIVLTLLEKKEQAYMDLMNMTEVGNTGQLNYHLKILGDLVEKNGNGRYRLTEKGQLASQVLMRFPEKTSKHVPIRGGDAILIGFIGFILALANPWFWDFGAGVIYVSFVVLLIIIYALMVPGAVMWLLTVRRTNSHDTYDLFKPPLVALAALVLLFVLMAALHINVTISSSGASVTQPTIPSFLLMGFFLFAGVGISEVLNKALNTGH